MKIRGRRRCKDCGREWSYYETGDVACPDCGSVESVGVDDERTLHTDAPVELDLTGVRSEVDRRPLRDVAADAGEVARSYFLSRGFVDAGELRSLDGVVVAAAELRHAAGALGRALVASEDEERYFLALLAGADDGERPEEVPESMRSARGFGTADVVEAYRSDLSAWLNEHPDPAAEELLGRVRDHAKRIRALDGEVTPGEADRLLSATRELGTYLRDGEETALARARERLERLG